MIKDELLPYLGWTVILATLMVFSSISVSVIWLKSWSPILTYTDLWLRVFLMTKILFSHQNFGLCQRHRSSSWNLESTIFKHAMSSSDHMFWRHQTASTELKISQSLILISSYVLVKKINSDLNLIVYLPYWGMPIDSKVATRATIQGYLFT